MSSPSTSATLHLRCPDCGDSVPVNLTLTSQVDKPAGLAEIRVTVNDDAPDCFTRHVMAAPQAHPSFATRSDA